MCYPRAMPDRSSKHPKRPRDLNQLAAAIVREATEHDEPAGRQTLDSTEESGKNPAAVALGRLGGLKGGKARAESLTPKRRKQIAKRAAQARWRKTPKT